MPTSYTKNCRRLFAPLVVALLLAAVSGIVAAAPGQANTYVQAATGTVYWYNDFAQDWEHRDTAEFSLGHQFGGWFDTNLTWSVRTDISTLLTMDSRLRLLRLGPASLGLKMRGSAGTGLDADVWVFRSVAAGPELRLQLGRRVVSAYGIAGLQEHSVWHYNQMRAPFAEAGASVLPAAGLSGVVAGGSWVATEHPTKENAFQSSWSGYLGYRKAF